MPAKRPKSSKLDLPRPFVIVDFLFDRGLLSVSIKNAGSSPATNVRVEFSHKLMGVDGTVEVSAQALFNSLEFLPAGKEIATFLDTSASYFRSKQPTLVSAQITYRDIENRKFAQTIHHNLEIYRDIGFVALASPRPLPVATG